MLVYNAHGPNGLPTQSSFNTNVIDLKKQRLHDEGLDDHIPNARVAASLEQTKLEKELIKHHLRDQEQLIKADLRGTQAIKR